MKLHTRLLLLAATSAFAMPALAEETDRAEAEAEAEAEAVQSAAPARPP